MTLAVLEPLVIATDACVGLDVSELRRAIARAPVDQGCADQQTDGGTRCEACKAQSVVDDVTTVDGL